MNKPTKNSRLVAAIILSEWLENGSFPEQRLSKIKDSRFFVMEVVHGVLEKILY